MIASRVCCRGIAALAVLSVLEVMSARPAASANIEGIGDGAAAYRQHCAACHGADLLGSAGPALRGPGFAARWIGNEAALYDEIAKTMPLGAAGSLPAMVYSTITTYLLAQSAPPAAATAKVDPAIPPPPIAVALPAAPKRLGTPVTSVPDDAELLNPAAGDWLRYNRDNSGQRYSPLTQITPANAQRLAPKCIFQTGEVGSFQSSPVVRDGRLYVTTVHRTYAIDAATCRRLWVHEYVPSGSVFEYMPTNRGVALYKGMVIRGTLDGHLIALDAVNGSPIWDTWVADSSKGFFLSAAPAVFDGKLYIGEAGGDYGASAHLRAFDATTGRALWAFNIIPSDGEPGRETWPASGLRGGGSMWTTITIEPGTRSLYASTGNPYLNFDGNQRSGDNLYTDSVIVLDADTGRLKWYVQQNPHDVRDWDTTGAPVIYSAGGHKLLAVGTKDARLYLYDRDAHDLIVRRDLTRRENATGILPPGVPTHVCPGSLGGVEWNGPAFDPANGLLYVNTVDWCVTITPQTSKERNPGGGTPAFDPPEKARGWLRAFDAFTLQERWHYEADSPMLAGITPTASGLLLTGTGSGHFFAFDANTGRSLYDFYTGGPLAGGVSTYLVNDRQYVAVVSGNSSKLIWQTSGAGPIVVVFGLP